MILVQNLQQLLSGNKLALILLLFVFGLVSCGGSKDVPRKSRTSTSRPVKKTPKKAPKKKVVKVDDKRWTPSEDPAEEIKSKEQSQEAILDKADVYNVSLMIPFDTGNALRNASSSSDKFVNYYSGVTMALQDLEEMDLGLNIMVYDAAIGFRSKLAEKFNETADVIIGPYDTRDLKEVAAYGKAREIPVVSPWKASKKITEENPYYIQLSPNPSDFFEKITDHINENFDPDQVILLGRNTKKDKILQRYIQRYHKKSHKKKPFHEYIVDVDSLMTGDFAFDSLFMTPKDVVFVIPNYSSKDESYVYNTIRRISTEKGMKRCFVYGMPILLNSDRITFDYYRNLNLRICRSKFVDERQQSVADFKSRFYRQYADLPTKDAYEGYDMMMFVGTNLDKYGRNFQKHIAGSSFESLQTVYRVEALEPKGADTSEREENVNYYQNMHLDIIQFQDNSFKRIR